MLFNALERYEFFYTSKFVRFTLLLSIVRIIESCILDLYKIYDMKKLLLLPLLFISVISFGQAPNYVPTDSLVIRLHEDSLSIKGREVFYKETLFSGIVFSTYDNGQLKGEVPVEDGKKNGLSRMWHENGQLFRKVNYKAGKKEGVGRNWYDNGQLKGEYNYKEGKRDGLARNWHYNGQLDFERNYINNERISEKCFDEDGNKIECH